MSEAKLLSCSQCNSPVSSTVDKCPKCKSSWFAHAFSCYCCGKPVKKNDAIEKKAFETNWMQISEIDPTVQHFSYAQQCVNPNEWTAPGFRSASEGAKRYRTNEFTPDGHMVTSEESDLKVGSGTTYYRLYHKECYGHVSKFREEYTHVVECSLCKKVNHFYSSSNRMSYECESCGHPGKSIKPKLGGFSCIHCDFPLNETYESVVKLNNFGSNIYIHRICYPDQLQKQREELVSGNEVRRIKRHDEEERKRLKDEAEKLRAMQNHQSTEQLISFFELAPFAFAALVGIISGMGVPHPVFAVIYGIFIGGIGWFLSNLICSPIASLIRGSKSK